MAIKRTVHSSHSEYLDPRNCDSVLSFKVTRSRKVSGSLDLSDCNRKISWYFDDYGSDPLKKIDKILDLITCFRSEFVQAQIMHAKRVRTPRKRIK